MRVGFRREDALYRSRWSKSDCCWVEVNLATLTCWAYYQILNNGVSLSLLNNQFFIFLLSMILLVMKELCVQLK